MMTTDDNIIKMSDVTMTIGGGDWLGRKSPNHIEFIHRPTNIRVEGMCELDDKECKQKLFERLEALVRAQGENGGKL